MLSQSCFISAQARQTSLAKEFLEFLVTGKRSLDFCMSVPGHLIPPLQSVMSLLDAYDGPNAAYLNTHREEIALQFGLMPRVYCWGTNLGSLATGTFHPTRTIAPIGGVIQGERPPGAELINEVVIGGRPRAQAFAEYLHDQIVDRAELIGVAGVNPHFGTEMLEEVRTAATDWGFRGIKFMPLKHDFDGHDAILKPFMELARELGLYVTIHTGPNESQPIKARPLAAAYPEVPILLDHMGMRSWVNQSIELAQAYSNVYLLTTVIAAAEPFRVRIAVNELGPERILFGSNSPTSIPAMNVEGIRRLQLGDEAEALIFRENARRVLHVDP